MAALSKHNPIGGVDAAKVTALSVAISGWTIDPDAVTSPARVHMYVDGRLAGAVVANQARDDVLRAYPRAGAKHGFTFSGPLPAGTHEICAYAINWGAGSANPKLGCRTFTLGGPPVGELEKVSTGPGQVKALGWAVDPDTVDSIGVHVYVDGKYTQAVVAKVKRTDVEKARPGYGSAHGFDVTLPVAAGKRTVCAYGINVRSGGRNTRLGCATVTVPEFVPVGNVDKATPGPGTLTANGWALDKDALTKAVEVRVKVDGEVEATVTADELRHDIALAFPGAGDGHGWSAELTGISKGKHTVCAYGVNIGKGTAEEKLACADPVTVP